MAPLMFLRRFESLEAKVELWKLRELRARGRLLSLEVSMAAVLKYNPQPDLAATSQR